jgi:hypothetical protein
MCKKPLAILSFGISVSLLLLGCTAQAETNNLQSLFFSEKCKGTCWMGIEPQISTTSEAITILEKVYGDENVVLDSGTISWNAENPNWNNRGYVFTNNNKVNFIMVWFPEPFMEVRDIISQMDNPDSVGLVISGSVIKCTGASLLYPKTGLEIQLSPINKSVGVTDNQIVNGFVINSPWSSGNYPGTDTAIISWDGYHEYCPEKWSWEE